jgi:hypothetical protein
VRHGGNHSAIRFLIYMNKTTRRTLSGIRIRAIGALVVIAGFGWISAEAAEDTTCKLVIDAMAKAVLTPNHQYMTLKLDALNGGKPQDSEIIDTGKATYIRHDGKWKPSISPQSMLDQMNENRKNAKTTCHFVRDEAIDGSNASLYTVHEDSPDGGAADSKIWLAKANALPIHVSLDMEGMHSESRYVYGAVSVPSLN